MKPARASSSWGMAPLLERWRQGGRPGGSDTSLTGRQVITAFLAFFGAIFVMNGVLIYWAVATNSGLVANEPYRKGLHYNERIAADEQQKRLGWKGKIELTKAGRVALVLTDGAGQPVSGLKIETVLGRPATNRQDLRAAMVEAAAGRYEADIAALDAGAWLVSLEARRDTQGPIYRIRRRVWLTP